MTQPADQDITMTIEKQVLEEYGQSMLDDFQSWDQEIKKAPKLNIDNML